MSYSLEIDNREAKLIEYFKDKPNIIIKQLDIGDLIFKLENDVSIIIERKSVNDLFSSIKDGRFREQKKRLLSNFNPNKIIYLIEGQIPSYNKPTYYGSLVNCLMRDNIKLFQTKNINETINFIETIKKRFDDKAGYIYNTLNGGSAIAQTNYVDTIKLKKKDNLTPENFQIITLAQIPGMSTSKAKVIMDEYKSIENLIIHLKENDIQFIQDLKLNNRKIGGKVATRIKDFLLCSN
tara:strand:- start:534 stop:1244 length:711 start_codon:yes stop_codon:yes gene_type:complete